MLDEVTQYAVLELDLNGNILSCNSGCRHLFQYAPDEMIGRHFSQLYAGEDAAWGKPQQQLQIAAERGSCSEQGFRIRNGGSRFWANVLISAFRGDGLAVRGFVKIVHDDTSRHQTEQILRDSERRLRNIVDNAVDGIITITEQGVIQTVNPAVERIFGYTADELIGRNVKLLMPAPYQQQHDQYLGNYVGTGHRKIIGIGREVLGQRRDGSIFPVDLAVSEVRLDDRRIFTGIIRDITERKRSEQAVRDSEARHRAIFETAVDGIVTIDERGTIESINPAVISLFGYVSEELVGQNVSVLMPSPFRDEHDSYLAHYRKTGEKRIIGIGREVIGRRKDGSTFPMDLAVSELQIAGRRMFTGLIRDITERRQSEERLSNLLASEQRARADAERASRAKDDFLAVLSHELRTPLTPSLFTLSSLQADPAVPQYVRDDIEAVRRNVELEARLIDDLLDLTRIARGKLLLSPAPADAHKLIQHAVSIGSGEAGPEIRLDLTAVHHFVRADPARIQQVLWNLLSNAQKFTPLDGEITVRSSNPHRDVLRIEVADTGRGISPDLLPHVFEAFEQGEPATARQFGGLGLGLAIAKRIIDAHGGRIGAQSKGVGHGALFTVELETIRTPRPYHPAAAEPADESPARALRILLLEDHISTLRVLARLLQQLGHQTATASTVAAAKAIFDTQEFDLLISDVGLPDGTGHDLMRHAREKSKMPGIALSGYGMAEDVEASLHAGFNIHLTKPIDIDKLAAVMHQLTK